MKIDEDYHHEYDDNEDSGKEMATSEFEGDMK